MSTVAARDHVAYGRVIRNGLLLAAAVVLLTTLFAAAGSERLGWDFRFSYLPAAESVLGLESPYPEVPEVALAEREVYVYPPQLAFLLVPFALVPAETAAVLAVVGALAALLGALWLVGLRDPLCFAAFLLWAPAFNELEMANASALVALGLALAWRFRSTIWPLAAAVGLVVSMKLFLWPLVVWTVVRRAAAAALAVGVGLAATVVTWAAIRFTGLVEYPELLRDFSDAQSETSYSIVAIASQLGLADGVGRAFSVAAGAALLVACWSGRRNDPFRSFVFAIAASLALTPIVWQHYLVALAVPLAIARPRFSALWLLPVVLWLSPRAGNGDLLTTFLPAAVASVVLAILIIRPRPSAVVAGATA